MEIKKYMIKCMAVGCLLAAAGCNDDDSWAPGPAAEANQVYFNESDPATVELVKNQEQSYTFTLSRTDAVEAIVVPITVEAPADFEAPAQVEFAAGQKTAEITVLFKGTENVGTYNCTLSIEEGPYNSPYTSLLSSVSIRLIVASWELFAEDVYFDCHSYASIPQPDFYADLYKMEGEDMYRFNNFMEGYNLTFTVKEAQKSDSPDYWSAGDYYIYPENGSNGQDVYGYEAWFFDADKGTGSFPLYPRDETEFYWNYSYLYTGPELYGTYINFDGQFGYIYGSFSQYSMDGTLLNENYNTLEFYW